MGHLSVMSPTDLFLPKVGQEPGYRSTFPRQSGPSIFSATCFLEQSGKAFSMGIPAQLMDCGAPCPIDPRILVFDLPGAEKIFLILIDD
jgi:hypothetical protein